MEDRKTIFNYLGEVLIIFAITIISTLVFAKFFGEAAKEISTMYQLGSEGLAGETMIQLLGISAIIIGLKYLLTESRLTAKIALFIRIAMMLAAIAGAVAFFAWLFDWFPINMWKPWISFFVTFIVYFAVSYWAMWVKTGLENKKLEQALKKYQEEVAGDETENNQVK